MKYVVSLLVCCVAAVTVASMSPATSTREEPPVFFQATLVAQDLFKQSVSFNDGLPGNVVQNREKLNRDSDLYFDAYEPNRLTVANQGGERATVLDCGHWKDLALEYGYSETVGGGQGFVSIRFVDDVLVIKGPDGTQPYTRGIDFLEETPTHYSVSFRPRIGHIYLIHVIDIHNPDFEHIVKLMVTSGIKDLQVSVIWENLRILP